MAISAVLEKNSLIEGLGAARVGGVSTYPPNHCTMDAKKPMRGVLAVSAIVPQAQTEQLTEHMCVSHIARGGSVHRACNILCKLLLHT